MNLEEIAQQLTEFGKNLEREVKHLDGYAFFIGLEQSKNKNISNIAQVGFNDAYFLLGVLEAVVTDLKDQHNIIVEYEVKQHLYQ